MTGRYQLENYEQCCQLLGGEKLFLYSYKKAKNKQLQKSVQKIEKKEIKFAVYINKFKFYGKHYSI